MPKRKPFKCKSEAQKKAIKANYARMAEVKKAEQKNSCGDNSFLKRKGRKEKWNRVHFFVREKKLNENMKDENKLEHPAWVFEQSRTRYKAIHFTSSFSTNGDLNEKLKHNIDPDSTEDCYAVQFRGPVPMNMYQPTLKKYRIHKEDMPVIKRLKKQK